MSSEFDKNFQMTVRKKLMMKQKPVSPRMQVTVNSSLEMKAKIQSKKRNFEKLSAGSLNCSLESLYSNKMSFTEAKRRIKYKM